MEVSKTVMQKHPKSSFGNIKGFTKKRKPYSNSESHLTQFSIIFPKQIL